MKNSFEKFSKFYIKLLTCNYVSAVEIGRKTACPKWVCLGLLYREIEKEKYLNSLTNTLIFSLKVDHKYQLCPT